MDNEPVPQSLTHDEKKAAEAAFARRPFNPKWSARARLVYDGIARSLLPKPEETEKTAMTPDVGATTGEDTPAPSLQEEATTQDQIEEPVQKQETIPVPLTIPFKRALESGALIDVTQTARQVGLSFSVTVTKPLWDVGIAPMRSMSQEEQSSRLRDILMAFRLRLATQSTVSPLIDFPALLALPPQGVPQPLPLFALFQTDEHNRATATLLLPSEVSTSIIPIN